MTSAVLFAVARLGYVVNIRQDGELYVATGYRDGETFVARACEAYAAASGNLYDPAGNGRVEPRPSAL